MPKTTPPRSFVETQIPVGDLVFNVLRSGPSEGLPLVFLHGFPTFSGAWRQVIARLPDSMACHAPDLLGFNRSSAPRELDRYHFDVAVKDMAALIEQVSDSGRAIVIGHDVGGMLAYALATSRPDMVAGLVVVNGAHTAAYGHALRKNRAQAEAASYLDVLQHPGADALFSAENYAQLRKVMHGMIAPDGDPQIMTQMAAAWARAGSLDGAISWYRANTFERPDPATINGSAEAATTPIAAGARITMPHLLIWGTPDPYLADVNKTLVAPLCDQFARLDLPGLGHAPHLRRPDLVARAIAAFATRVLGDAAGA